MTYYAHRSDHIKSRLPRSWNDPYTGSYYMGLDTMTLEELADLGWYPVRLEPLEPGAAGHGEFPSEPTNGEWVIPSLPGDPSIALTNAKTQKYQQRLDALLNARNGGFLFNGKRVDSDQESRMLISGAVQLATLALMAGTPEALAQFAASLGAGWRYSDGTIAATDATGMIALGTALAERIAVCDAVSQAHKAAIEACTTADECNALDVTTGYELN